MALREYKCTECGLLVEHLIPTSQTPPETKPCSRCGKPAVFLTTPSRIGIMTTNFSHQKIDVAIGADAARRWEDIKTRQEMRDHVRQTTGSMGLSMVGRNEFAPVTEDNRQTRTEVASAIEKSGGFDTVSEQKS